MYPNACVSEEQVYHPVSSFAHYLTEVLRIHSLTPVSTQPYTTFRQERNTRSAPSERTNDPHGQIVELSPFATMLTIIQFSEISAVCIHKNIVDLFLGTTGYPQESEEEETR